MPDYPAIVDQAIADAPRFFADATAVFGFLDATYGYSLHAQHIESMDYVPDAEIEIVYRWRGRKPGKGAVRIYWFLHPASVDVQFVLLNIPGVYRGMQDITTTVFLHDLAAMRGHSDDPDFLLPYDAPYSYAPGGRLVNKRVKIVQTNMRGILEGLARATERYATDILRGDSNVFVEAMEYYEQKRAEAGSAGN